MTAIVVRVLDFETTGLPEDPESAVCEVGFIDVDAFRPEKTIDESSAWTSLIDPGRPIPPEISAIHHIVDQDVTGKPTFETAIQRLNARLTSNDVYAAHCADFERRYFPGEPRRWIDTWKCALRAWPDAPGHSNQVLRYWLGIDIDPVRAAPPHRALPDAYVTAHILRKLLLLRPVERLVEISSKPAFLPRITFGKHRGMTFAALATEHPDYLYWLLKQPDMDEGVKFTARWHLSKVAA